MLGDNKSSVCVVMVLLIQLPHSYEHDRGPPQ